MNCSTAFGRTLESLVIKQQTEALDIPNRFAMTLYSDVAPRTNRNVATYNSGKILTFLKHSHWWVSTFPATGRQFSNRYS